MFRQTPQLAMAGSCLLWLVGLGRSAKAAPSVATLSDSSASALPYVASSSPATRLVSPGTRPDSNFNTYLHICLYTHIHNIHIHIYRYTYIHNYTYTYVHIYIYTYFHIHTYIHVYITYTYIHIYTYTYIHICIYTYIHIHSYIIYVHIFMHTFIHIYLYIYTTPHECTSVCARRKFKIGFRMHPAQVETGWSRIRSPRLHGTLRCTEEQCYF